MRPSRFGLERNENVKFTRFIHWVDSKCTNHLVGRVSLVSNGSYNKWFIEYYGDCLNELKQTDDFIMLPGFDHRNNDKSLVLEYPFNFTPHFISQRVVSPKRKDMDSILETFGMTSYSDEEYLDKTHGVCVENKFFISDKEDASDFYNWYLHYWMQPEGYKMTEEEFRRR